MSELLSFESARAQLIAAAAQFLTGCETVPTLDAMGRVLAADLLSSVAVPPLDNSAMDGYAVRSADVAAIGTRLPVSQRIAAGSVGLTLTPGTAARIFTGAPIPPGADAVVMQENCVAVDGSVQIKHLPEAGENIRRSGEDIAPGQVVLSAGTLLGPAQLGVAASVGAACLEVRRRLRVALFSTGDELVMPGDDLHPGVIYNSNRYTLISLLRELGCAVSDLGIVPDTLEPTRETLRTAAQEHDLILTSGGVSVGEEDHVKAAVAAEGGINLWKLAIKPGKPLAYGQIHREVGGEAGNSRSTAPRLLNGQAADNRHSTSEAGETASGIRGTALQGSAAFIGLPGNPVSSFVTFLTLVRPFIRAAQGATGVDVAPRRLRADFDWPRNYQAGGKVESRREFLRARINAEGGVELYPHQGSGVLTSCAWADGLIDNPPEQVIRRGDAVNFLAFADLLR